MHYPCQKAASTNVFIFLGPTALAYAHGLKHRVKHRITTKTILQSAAIIAVVFLLLVGGEQVFKVLRHQQLVRHYAELNSHGPMGLPVMIDGVAASTLFTSSPQAMALPSPHRVVSVHSTNATSWPFSAPSSGYSEDYYGDFVDESIVHQMTEIGLKTLTGASTLSNAWATLLPDYIPGESIAIKLNFNDSIMGGGVSGYGDNDAYVDALPQILNAIVYGLRLRGVPETNVWVYEASRYITDRFRNLVTYTNIQYFDHHAGRPDVQLASFTNGTPGAQIDFTGTGYTDSHQVSDVLVDATYLINVPIMKPHGGAGITLAIKNHLGSINGFYTGSANMHQWFYLYGSQYTSATNPLINIYCNTNICDKTILIVGDGLYGTYPSNNEIPKRWSSFGNIAPNMLFFYVDPVAGDSVMFDYIDREIYVNSRSEDVLILAANAGLGVHERWDSDISRQYTAIDYREIDLDIPQIMSFGSSNHFAISEWSSLSGTTYQLEYTDNPTNANWPVMSVVTADGPTVLLIDTNQGVAAQRFYRAVSQ